MQKSSSIRQFVEAKQFDGFKKVTLTNLFQNQLQSKQFVSEGSVSKPSRPHTMHLTRSKNPRLQSSNFKQSLKTQTKRPLTQSIERNYPRFTSSAELGRSHEDDKLRVRKAYGRMNILADGVEMEEDKQITSIFNFLQTLSETNNHHQKVFTYLAWKLKDLVYADSSLEGLKQIAQRTKNSFIIKIVLHKTLNATYKDLCTMLIQQTSKILLDKEQNEQENSQRIGELTEKIQQKDDIIAKLKAEMIYYMDHPSKDLYPFIDELEKGKAQLKRELAAARQAQYELEGQTHMYKIANMNLGDKIQQLKTKIYQFQLEKLSSLKDVEKNSELTEFQNNVVDLKSMLHKSVLRMEGVKQQYDKVKGYNEELISQRSKLAKRAAVGFQQLTPRPKFTKIFMENNLDFSKLINPQPSTEEIVELLVKTCKELFRDRQVELSTQRIQNSKSKSKKKKEKTVPDKAIQGLMQANEQIRKTAGSAEQVQKAFNRQKSQREALQSNKKK